MSALTASTSISISIKLLEHRSSTPRSSKIRLNIPERTKIRANMNKSPYFDHKLNMVIDFYSVLRKFNLHRLKDVDYSPESFEWRYYIYMLDKQLKRKLKLNRIKREQQ